MSVLHNLGGVHEILSNVLLHNAFGLIGVNDVAYLLLQIGAEPFAKNLYAHVLQKNHTEGTLGENVVILGEDDDEDSVYHVKVRNVGAHLIKEVFQGDLLYTAHGDNQRRDKQM